MSDASTSTLMGFAAFVVAVTLWFVTLPVKTGAGVAIISFI